MADLRVYQALVNATISANLGIELVHENRLMLPDPTTPYAMIRYLPADTKIFTLKGDISDTFGLFRLLFCYPLDGGAVAARSKIQELFTAFPLGRHVVYDGVEVVITGHNTDSGLELEQSYRIAADLRYRALV